MPLSVVGEFIFEMVGQVVVEIIYEMILKPLFWVAGYGVLFVLTLSQCQPTDTPEQDAWIAVQKWRPYLRENGRILVSSDAVRLLGFIFYVVVLLVWLERYLIRA